MEGPKTGALKLYDLSRRSFLQMLQFRNPVWGFRIFHLLFLALFWSQTLCATSTTRFWVLFDNKISEEQFTTAVTKLQGHCNISAHVQSVWLRGASYELSDQAYECVSSLPFVASVQPVARFHSPRPSALKKQFPGLRRQNSLHQINAAHTLLAILGTPEAGSGVRIAFFDSGFFLDHPCLEHLVESGRIIGDSDFVDRDQSVADYDRSGGSHGTATASVVAGLDPQTEFRGIAPYGRFLFARTEDDYGESRTEEDNWIAALQWAVEMDIDIVNSSVGYRSGFDNPLENYSQQDLDGSSALISIAADSAAAHGVVIVNSMGNEFGARNTDSLSVIFDSTTLVVPADAQGVISVGAVALDSSIAYFSSVGPTADGRIKPDVVALGNGVIVASVGGGTPYEYQSGTSFSAPIVTGILAITAQRWGRAKAREKLVQSARFSPFQDQVNSIYGAGLPMALNALLDSAEGYIITSAPNYIWEKAQEVRLNGAALPRSAVDSGGVYLADVSIGDSVSFYIGARKFNRVVDTLPFIESVHSTTHYTVTIVDETEISMQGIILSYRDMAADSFEQFLVYGNEPVVLQSSSAGLELRISAAVASQLQGTINPVFLQCEEASCTFSLPITSFIRPSFFLAPNVLKPGDDLVCRASVAQGTFYKFVLRSMSGKIVYSTAGYFNKDSSEGLRLRVPIENTFVPGMYVAYFENEEIRKKRKLLIVE